MRSHDECGELAFQCTCNTASTDSATATTTATATATPESNSVQQNGQRAAYDPRHPVW